MIRLEHIFLADGHAYFGRHGQLAADHPVRSVEAVECVAGQGLRGDRFFGYKPDYRGQVTLFSREVLDQLRDAFGCPALDPAATRRNLLVSGLDLPALIGAEFHLQGVRLEGVEECRPCYWMNQALAPGAEAWLKGRGGLRCRIHTSGWLRVDRPARASG